MNVEVVFLEYSDILEYVEDDTVYLNLYSIGRVFSDITIGLDRCILHGLLHILFPNLLEEEVCRIEEIIYYLLYRNDRCRV